MKCINCQQNKELECCKTCYREAVVESVNKMWDLDKLERVKKLLDALIVEITKGEVSGVPDKKRPWEEAF